MKTRTGSLKLVIHPPFQRLCSQGVLLIPTPVSKSTTVLETYRFSPTLLRVQPYWAAGHWCWCPLHLPHCLYYTQPSHGILLCTSVLHHLKESYTLMKKKEIQGAEKALGDYSITSWFCNTYLPSFSPKICQKKKNQWLCFPFLSWLLFAKSVVGKLVINISFLIASPWEQQTWRLLCQHFILTELNPVGCCVFFKSAEEKQYRGC